MDASELFQRVDTIFLIVDDLDDATTWYTESLGAEARWKTDHISVVAFDDDLPITLVSRESCGGVHPSFNLFTPDVEKAHDFLKDRKVDVSEIQHHGNVSTFDFRDESGNLLNVYHYEEEQG